MHNNCLSLTFNSKPKLHKLHHKKLLISFAFLLSALLAFSCITSYTYDKTFFFTSGAPDKAVNNETDLRNAINNAPTKKTYTITLNNDITLSDSPLIIPANKDITLTSNKANGYYKLIGVGSGTLTVESNGVLKLDGIIVTSGGGSMGGGVYVYDNGRLIMYSGEISDNTVVDWGGPFFNSAAYGGGVYNAGVFEMHGGTISNNNAVYRGTNNAGAGGGVYNSGTFTMSGGTISNNHADISGGGVYNTNSGTFIMSGGEITDNTAYWGGGVYNSGTFDRRGGTISKNSATVSGNNVYPDDNGDSLDNNGTGDSSNGGGSSNGNWITDENNGITNDNIGGFSLRELVVMCLFVVVSLFVVVVVLFFSFQKRIEQVEAKINRPVDS